MEDRIKQIVKSEAKGNILYLMKRDQRIFENHCITFAYSLSNDYESQFYIGIELDKIKMNIRQKKFMLEGLVEMAEDCHKNNIHLDIVEDLDEYVADHDIKAIIVDFNPMREYLERTKEIEKLCKKNKISLYVIDAHNVVPCWLLKTYKRTAKAVRMDLYKEWDRFLKEYEKLEPHKRNSNVKVNEIFEKILGDLKDEKAIFKGGYKSGLAILKEFFEKKFSNYKENRNNPEVDYLSNLSPYFHFGQISPLNVMLEAISKHGKGASENYLTFISEAFVWRETAEHFVYHEKNYDNIEGALAWAKDTLLYHAQDVREKIYKPTQLEEAKTGDELWNAAQNQLVKSGKIHGYVRMYWAKTVLKWLEDPREALRLAIDLNDKYSIDGNDPNGYLGVMWSICGSMDRAFGERPIFGKIRPMKSFKCPTYVSKWGKITKSFFN